MNRRADSAQTSTSGQPKSLLSVFSHAARRSCSTYCDPAGSVPILRYSEHASRYMPRFRPPTGSSPAASGIGSSPVETPPPWLPGTCDDGALPSHGSSQGGAIGASCGHPAAHSYGTATSPAPRSPGRLIGCTLTALG